MGKIITIEEYQKRCDVNHNGSIKINDIHRVGNKTLGNVTCLNCGYNWEANIYKISRKQNFRSCNGCRKKIRKEHYDKISELYLQGKSYAEIAEYYGVSGTTIGRAIEDIGVKQSYRPQISKAKEKHLGQTHGYLEVVDILPAKKKCGHYIFVCLCEVCGKTKNISSKSFATRKNKTCGCISREYKIGQKSPHYKGYKTLSGFFFGQIKKGARTRCINFEINMEYLWKLFKKQKGLCALSGLPIKMPIRPQDEQTASLDRIDSSLGYVEGNVQWLHKYINKMKLDHDQDFFIELCHSVVECSKNKCGLMQPVVKNEMKDED
jgi:hypothetical protein